MKQRQQPKYIYTLYVLCIHYYRKRHYTQSEKLMTDGAATMFARIMYEKVHSTQLQNRVYIVVTYTVSTSELCQI